MGILFNNIKIIKKNNLDKLIESNIYYKTSSDSKECLLPIRSINKVYIINILNKHYSKMPLSFLHRIEKFVLEAELERRKKYSDEEKIKKTPEELYYINFYKSLTEEDKKEARLFVE